jgi:protein tyrosine/serine phosphatase
VGQNGELARWVELEGCFNFRDLGGYRSRDGRRTRTGQVFRADGLQHLTPRDLERLRREIGLAGVIDLRSSAEVQSDGRGRIAREPLAFHHVPLFERDERFEEPPRDFLADMGELYLFMLRSASEPIARVVRLLAETDAPCVFHCAAGKDRTGVISALLLGLLDVPRDTIIADYAFSRQNLDRINARLNASRSYREILEDLPQGASEAEPATMETFLDRVEARYGSLRGYAERAGVGDGVIDRLQARLLEDVPAP